MIYGRSLPHFAKFDNPRNLYIVMPRPCDETNLHSIGKNSAIGELRLFLDSEFAKLFAEGWNNRPVFAPLKSREGLSLERGE